MQVRAIHLRIDPWVFGSNLLIVWNKSGKFENRVDQSLEGWNRSQHGRSGSSELEEWILE